MIALKINVYVVLLLVMGLCCLEVQGQVKNIGVPQITNYKISEYKAGAKNWAIEQDNNGIMYFGNHFGVLEFNATTWRLVAQPENKTIVRSLAIDNQGTIWVGCQNDMGYLKTNIHGQTSFVSIKNKIPEAFQNFDDVWRIIIIKQGVLFVTNQALYFFDDNDVTVFKANYRFAPNIFVANDNIFLLDKSVGLVRLREDVMQPYDTSNFFKQNEISFILPHSDKTLLIGTFANGLFLYNNKTITAWNTTVNDFLIKNKINTAIPLQNNYYAIGTSLSGLLVIDKAGNAVQYINKSSGLQDNSVVFIKEDKNQNIWLTLDNGIDFIEISSAFTALNRYDELSSTVYTSAIYNERLFVGTGQGLYYKTWNKEPDLITNYKKFSLFDNVSQTVWATNTQNNILYIGSHVGSYAIKDETANKLSDLQGAWTFLPLQTDTNYMLQGGYNGLLLFKRNGNSWLFDKPVKGFSESSRVIAEDKNGTIWIAHGYKGVYKLTLNDTKDSVLQYSFYDSRKGFPSNLFISVFNIRNEMLFGTEKGVYTYNPQSDNMLQHQVYANILGTDKHIRLLKQDNDGNIWFVTGDENNDRTGYIQFTYNGKYDIVQTPFQVLKGQHVPGFENISFYNNEIFFGTKTGIIHYDKSVQKNYNIPFKIIIDRIVCPTLDSLVYGTTFGINNPLDTVYRNKAQTFTFENNGLQFSELCD